MVWNNKLNYQGDHGNKVSIYNGKGDYESFATSPANVLKMMILQSRAYVIDCIASYTKGQASKANYGVVYVKAAIDDLFMQVRSMLKNDYAGKKDMDNLFLTIVRKKESNNIKELREAFEMIDDYLLRKKITRIDYIENYDRTLVTEEDERNGL